MDLSLELLIWLHSSQPQYWENMEHLVQRLSITLVHLSKAFVALDLDVWTLPRILQSSSAFHIYSGILKVFYEGFINKFMVLLIYLHINGSVVYSGR